MPGSGPRHAFGLGPRILKQTEHHHVTEDQPLTSKCPCEARRLHVATLMKRMGIEALYRKPHTSNPARPCAAWLRHDATRFTPIWLAEIADHPAQSGLGSSSRAPLVQAQWTTDITCIPMARGFIYLAAVLDWFTRRVLAWRFSITLEADFCI